jgi:hypothetical protein
METKMVGTIYVHDGRSHGLAGDRTTLDLGPVLMMCRAKRQLRVGDEIQVPGGEILSVRRSRCWRNGRRWEQSVLIGESLPTISTRSNVLVGADLPAAS